MSLLGGIGESLSAYARGDLVARHGQDNRKHQQDQAKLAGLQSLLQQNDLPMEVYVHTIGALADLTGNKQTKLVADHLYEQMGQRQPLERVEPQTASAGTQAARVESAIGPPPPMTQVTHETIGELPRNVYTANMMLPGQIAKFNAQQAEKARYDTENDERTRKRQLDVQTLRGKQALERLPLQLENRLKIVDETFKQRARQEVDKLIAGGMAAEDATTYVLNKAEQDQNLRVARIAFLNTQKAAIPERIAQGWANVEANQLRAEIAADVAANHADIAAFDRDTKWAFADLDSVNREIDALQKRPDLLSDPSQPQWKEQLVGLQAQKAALLNQIWANKGKYVPSEVAPRRGLSSPPTRGSGGTTRKGKAKLTEAEIRAAGGTDATVQRARERGDLVP